MSSLLRGRRPPARLVLRESDDHHPEHRADSQKRPESQDSPDSPDSPNTPIPSGAASADSPSPTTSSFPSKNLPPSSTSAEKAPSVASSNAPESTGISSDARKEPTSSARNDPPSSVTSLSATTSSSTVIIVSQTPIPVTTSTLQKSSAASRQTEEPKTTTVPEQQAISSSSSPVPQAATSVPSTTAVPERAGKVSTHSKAMPLWAEGILIALAGLGALALVIFLILFVKKRRRRNKATLRFSRMNDDLSSLSTHDHDNFPQPPVAAHMTQTTTSTTPTLFRADPNHQPVSMSTNQSIPGRHMRHVPIITPGLPSANPFADPPLNKSYDMLRGRPRSTTLTDRGSWLKNPFQDPMSERFDPFGTLEEEARAQRKKYMKEVRRQQREEDERWAAGGYREGRKESEVTVEGMGVLDRSGAGRFPT